MSPIAMTHVLSYFPCISLARTQSEALLYYWGFSNQSNWIIDHYGIREVDWQNSYCDTTCLHIEGQAIVRRVIPTTGYHSIRIQLDVRERGLNPLEYCRAGYTTDLTPIWEEITVAQMDDGRVYGLTFSVPNNPIYNNQSTFQLRLENTGTAISDNCYFDNLYVYGIAYTPSPTMEPSQGPTIEPTKDPSKSPSEIPTSPSSIPSQYASANGKIAVDITTTTAVIPSVNNALDLSNEVGLEEWVYIAVGCGAVLCCLLAMIAAVSIRKRKDTNVRTVEKRRTQSWSASFDDGATNVLKNESDDVIRDEQAIEAKETEIRSAIIELEKMKSKQAEELYNNPSANSYQATKGGDHETPPGADAAIVEEFQLNTSGNLNQNDHEKDEEEKEEYDKLFGKGNLITSQNESVRKDDGESHVITTFKGDV